MKVRRQLEMAQTQQPTSFTLPAETITVMPRKIDWRRMVGTVAGHMVLLIGSVAMIIPMLWMISTSLKKSGQEWVFPPVWIPHPLWWRSYLEAINALPVPFYIYVLNTL